MVHSYGYRSGTRNKFAKRFKKHGNPSVGRLLANFKVGEFVDIKADAAVQKGMPHKFYHGRTGRVFNVTPRAVGVVVNKQVKSGKVFQKRICVRSVHVAPSRCQIDFRKRIADNNEILKKAKAEKKFIPVIKRSNAPPKDGRTVRVAESRIGRLAPIPFDFVAVYKL